MNKLEDRIRSGLAEAAERIPEPGTSLSREKGRAKRPAGVWMGVAAVIAVLVVFSPLILLNGSDPDSSPGESGTPSTAPVSTMPTVQNEPAHQDRFPVVVKVEETGDLIGLQRGHAFKSTDGGESWSEILVDGGADLVNVAPDGTVIAVDNGEHADATDALGPNSSVRPAPEVHIYDPVADEWRTTALPRPEFPVEDPRPVPMDGSGNCPKGGIQWTMDALSIAFGDRYVIAGEQRITEETVCDESYQIFWTSQDGSAWTVTDPTGIPGYLVGIIWFDGRYIAYGADGPWYRTDRSRMPQVWSSSDLAAWERADIDLSPLPDNAFIWLFPEEEASFGLGSTVVTTVTDGTLRLEVPVALAGAGPDENIADIDELNQWAETNDRVTITEDILDSLDIDFPLDDEELQKLTNYFHSDEANGRLVLESDDGTTWTSRYQSG